MNAEPMCGVDSPAAAPSRALEGTRRLWSAVRRKQATEHLRALALLESHRIAQQNLFAHDLAAERRLRDRAEASEEVLRRALEFKDALIQESNHRVKNTLQVAASLLSLHAHATTSPEIRSALLQSYDRLHVLSRAHELLSADTDPRGSILVPTLLEVMADALRESFAEVSARVRLQITSDPISIPADRAIPLALLANEVLTNAYKHAFPDDASGDLTVDLRRAVDGVIVLEIADNGIGMRSRGDGSGLGLNLIRTFASQLHGTLAFAAVDGAAGTKVTLTMPRDAAQSAG